MDHAPESNACQAVIGRHWHEVKQRRDSPPRVLRTLVFCTAAGVLEAFAVVDGYGGCEPHRVGEWDVAFIAWETDLAQKAQNRRVGDEIEVGDLRHLLIAKDGARLPRDESGKAPTTVADWHNAIRHERALRGLGEQIHHNQKELREALRERRRALERALQRLDVFPELAPYRPSLTARLERQDDLEREHEMRQELCASSEAMPEQSLRSLLRQQERFRERLENCRQRDAQELAAFREEHARLEEAQYAFDQKGQGQLGLLIGYETLSIKL